MKKGRQDRIAETLTHIFHTVRTLKKEARSKQKLRCFFNMERHRRTNMIEDRIEIVGMILANCSWLLR